MEFSAVLLSTENAQSGKENCLKIRSIQAKLFGSGEFDFLPESADFLLEKEQASADGLIVKICAFGGAVFFIRTKYLFQISFSDILNRFSSGDFAEFDETESEAIFRAGISFSAEKKACDYLSRCEHCRFALFQKLLQKGFQKESILPALDFLEEKGILSDERFAQMWIRSHCISKAQGKTRLVSELVKRGVSRQKAVLAVENHFCEISEEDECVRAAKIAVRNGKKGEKLLKSLIDSGFPFKMAKKTVEILESQS